MGSGTCCITATASSPNYAALDVGLTQGGSLIMSLGNFVATATASGGRDGIYSIVCPYTVPAGQTYTVALSGYISRAAEQLVNLAIYVLSIFQQYESPNTPVQPERSLGKRGEPTTWQVPPF